MSDRLATVLRCIARSPGITAAEIHRMTGAGFSPGATYQAVNKLRRAGHIITWEMATDKSVKRLYLRAHQRVMDAHRQLRSSGVIV